MGGEAGLDDGCVDRSLPRWFSGESGLEREGGELGAPTKGACSSVNRMFYDALWVELHHGRSGEWCAVLVLALLC